MQLVTLTTDWGYKDHYIGAVKAKLYSSIEDCNVVDITHSIDKYNILSGAFTVKNACLGFPKGTIHIIDIDCVETKDYQHIVVEWNEQYFICTDNGLPSIVFEGLKGVKIIGLNVFQESNYFTFAAYDLFCKVAALIYYEKSTISLGLENNQFYKKATTFLPIITKEYIICTIEHIDDYGNLFLNLNIDKFLEIIWDGKFSIEIERYNISKISNSYDDVRINLPLLTVASTGQLQISLNKANASELLGYNIGSQITIYLGESRG